MADSAIAELTTPDKAPPLWEIPEVTGQEAPEAPVLLSEEPKAPEAPIEPKKPENPPTETQEPALKGKARENFAKLEQKAKEAEERANKLNADYEAAQVRLKEFEEKQAKFQSINVEDYQRQIQEREQQLVQLQNELKFVALEKDPEFVARFETPKTQLQGILKEMALSTGVDETTFQRALADEDRMQDIRDSLQPAQQRRWDAALIQIEQVNLQKQQALQNRDQTYQEINSRREAAWKQQRSEVLNQNLQIARKVAMEPFEKAPALKEDAELQKLVQDTLEAVAGGNGAEKWNAEEIMRQVAAATVQTKILTKQHEIIQGQTAEIESLKKQVEQHESFIKQKYGSLPSTEVVTTGKEKEKPRPIWEVTDELVRGTGAGGFI